MPTPKRSERSFRSKTPTRAKSKSRSRSRSRGRSRARSKSPSRTRKTTQTPSPARKSPARKPRQPPAEKPSPKDAGTPTRRSSARLAEKEEKREQEKVEQASGDAKNDNAANKSPKKTAKGKSGFPYEFGGPIGTFFMGIGLPAFMLYLNFACTKKSCDIRKVPSFSKDWRTYFDAEAAGIYVGWVLFQAILAVLPIGKVVQGMPVKGGKRLDYRCNGFLSFLVSVAMMGAAVYLKFPVNKLHSKFIQLACTSIVFSLVLSVYLSFRARALAANAKAEGGNSGCPTYDWFMGKELNPRIGPLDLKFFCELRPGLIGWTMLNMAFLAEAYNTNTFTPAMGMVAFFQAFYVADGLFFEPAILSTMDITHDGFGYMLAFGDLAWVPFTYCLQVRYLLEHPQQWPNWALAGFVLVWLAGYLMFRGSNSQKAQFRTNPHDPALAHLETIPGGQGKKLLVGGWWGLCRHPNYLGDLIMALSWSLPCGTGSVVPFFYPLYFLVLLVHRAHRDDVQCRKKHGAAWDRYCERVPNYIFPKVY